MSKITMAAALGVGYVLGARAGRDRYREIRARATSLWQSEAVQTQAARAQEVAKDQAAKVQEAAKDRLPSQLGGRADGSAPSGRAETPAGNPGTASATDGASAPDRELGAVDAPGATA